MNHENTITYQGDLTQGSPKSFDNLWQIPITIDNFQQFFMYFTIEIDRGLFAACFYHFINLELSYPSYPSIKVGTLLYIFSSRENEYVLNF